MLRARSSTPLRARGIAIGLAGTVTLAAACSSQRVSLDDQSVASVPAETSSASSAIALARQVARHETRLSRALAVPIAASEWTSNAGGFVGRGWLAGEDDASVGASAPGDAASSFTIGLRATRSRLGVTFEGARTAAPHVEEGSLVYSNVYPSTDIVMTLEGGRFEELLLLRDASAPTSFAWRVGVPDGIANVRVEDDGGVRFEDGHGDGVLHVLPPFAVDATGARRDAKLSWNAGRLAVALDTSGLVFPLLLDPAVESYFWVPRTPAASPGMRDSHALAYDAATDETILFGGIVCGSSCSATALNDTWGWNGTTWTQKSLSTSPAGRFWSGMVFDSTRSVNLLYGGVSSAGTDLSDTWEWTGAAWTQKSPAANPGARDSFALAFDATRQVVVLFGGEKCANKTCSTMTNLNDTWEWNGTNWSQMSTSTAPAPRTGSRMVFDSARQVDVLFGGTNCISDCTTLTEYGDTWEWNGTAWTQEAPASSPGGRDSVGMAYDSARSVTVLFGGYGSSGDTWEWNGTNWTQVTPEPSVTYRYYSPMTFDSSRGRTVIFAGTTAATDLDDTWEYYAHGGACTAGSQCDTGYCVDGVCCNTSSCGTCQACNTAASPGACAAVINAPDPPSCTGTQTCDDNGACKAVVGQPCPQGNTNCANGACVDGYCCNSACTGACDSCAQALGAPANGTCGPASKGYSGDPTCSGGYLCNGASDTCPATCSGDTNCASGYFCNANGSCQAQKAQGSTCSASAGVDCLQGQCHECATGNCVDGVCCDSSCSGSCEVCSKALGAPADGTCSTAPQGYAGTPTCAPYSCSGTSGSCPSGCGGANDCAAGAFCSNGQCQGTETPGQACGSNGACASGFCVDGVCCSSACTGECEACDVEASVGTCTPVAGSPHGTARSACPVGSATSPCSAAQCDGNTRTSCTGFVGSSVTCVQASCSSGMATLPAACDGLGNCPAPVTKQCAPYVCDGTSCKDQCASDTDCAAGQRCDTALGKCVAGVTCDGDHTITGADGQTTDCSPYSCNAAGCQTSCHSLLDCISPAVCNGSSQCVLPPSANGGTVKASCAVSRGSVGVAGGTDAETGGAGFLVLALTGLFRRRPRRSPSTKGASVTR
jgi:hypothetical protein